MVTFETTLKKVDFLLKVTLLVGLIPHICIEQIWH